MLTPFSSRNYRLYFGGQAVSMLGTWMTQTATIWLVYHITGSPFWLGAIAFLGQLPAIVLSPLGGVWVDRLDRLKLLKVTQALAMTQSLLLAFFTLTGRIDIWLLTALAMFQGLINAFDLPTRQSLNVLLAEKREHLPSIIAMNSSLINLARLVGPALAGFVIAFSNAGWCFLLDGVSYIAVLVALFAMRLTVPQPAPRMGSVWQELREGFNYTWGFLPIRALLLMTAAIGIFGLSYAVLIPVYAKTVFNGDARMLGLLMSASAAGSVLAALYLAGRKSIRGLGNAIVIGGIMASCALAVFAFSKILWLSVLCLVLTGMGGILIFASNNTLIQNLVEESKRGRTMSIYTVAFLGGMPLGALLTGSVANAIGITSATCINAAACLALAIAFAYWLPRLRHEARPVLERAGILPAAED
ncbi:MAG: MFS transporter [Chthoniobacterales bacterium]